jgi:3-deoxy-D-manno-octulosonate 8-phosphate phosphatase (KDO 8-P phosphatase)
MAPSITGKYLAHVPAAVLARARQVQLLSLDVDGVLTDGSLLLSDQGERLKTFNTLDGLGIKLLRQAGIEVALITGRKSLIVSQRAKALGIEHVYQHCEDKWQAVAELQAKFKLEAPAMAHMGDDLPDLGAMALGGFAICVPNAHPLVIEYAHYCTTRRGGNGAVREACDLILHARGLLENATMGFYRTDA